MPVVPSPQSQVNRSPFPGPRLTAQVNADTLGAATADGAQNVVNEGAKIYQQEKQNADQIVVLNAHNQTAELNQSLIADATSKRGMDAFGVLDTSMADYDKQTGDIAAGLHNDEQRLAYQQIRQQGRLQLGGTLQAHVSREHQVVDDQEFNAGLKNSQVAAVTASANQPPDIADAMIGFERGEQKRLIEQYAKRNGMTPDWVRAYTDKSLSATNANVIDQLTASGQDLRAKQFFEANRDTFKGDDLIHAQATLTESSTRGEAQRIGDQVLQQIVNGEVETEEDAVAEAIRLAGDDPKTRELATREASNNWNLHQRSMKQRQDQLFTDASDDFITTQQTKDIKPSTWVALTKSQRDAFYRAEKMAATGEQVPDGSPEYWRLYQQATTPSLYHKFDTTNLPESQSKMSPKNYAELQKLQADHRQKEPKDLPGYLTKEQIVKDVLVSNGMKPEPYDKNGIANTETLAFLNRLNTEVIAREQASGAKMPPEEIGKVASALMTKIVVNRAIPEGRDWTRRTLDSRIFGNPKWVEGQAGYEDVDLGRTYNLPGTALNVSEVPKDTKPLIVQILTKKNLKPTDDNIVITYNNWLADHPNGK